MATVIPAPRSGLFQGFEIGSRLAESRLTAIHRQKTSELEKRKLLNEIEMTKIRKSEGLDLGHLRALRARVLQHELDATARATTPKRLAEADVTRQVGNEMLTRELAAAKERDKERTTDRKWAIADRRRVENADQLENTMKTIDTIYQNKWTATAVDKIWQGKNAEDLFGLDGIEAIKESRTRGENIGDILLRLIERRGGVDPAELDRFKLLLSKRFQKLIEADQRYGENNILQGVPESNRPEGWPGTAQILELFGTLEKAAKNVVDKHTIRLEGEDLSYSKIFNRLQIDMDNINLEDRPKSMDEAILQLLGGDYITAKQATALRQVWRRRRARLNQMKNRPRRVE